MLQEYLVLHPSIDETAFSRCVEALSCWLFLALLSSWRARQSIHMRLHFDKFPNKVIESLRHSLLSHIQLS